MSKKISHLLKTEGNYTVTGSLWIEYEGNRCFGPGKMELLQLIDQTGSINKSAKVMGMSYKKAWKMVSELNNQLTGPMVITRIGGETGGGSILTDSAVALMAYHTTMRQRFMKFLEDEKEKLLKLH